MSLILYCCKFRKTSSTSGTPRNLTKDKKALLAAEDKEFSDLANLLKRQVQFGHDAKGIVTEPSKAPPLARRKLKTNTERKSNVAKVQDSHSVSALSPEADAKSSLSCLPEVLSFTEKYFIGHRRCFLIRNYFKVINLLILSLNSFCS